jgi:hypothetical protein
MKNYNFLFLYFTVFGLSYQSIINGGVGNKLIDSVLISIFFVFTYVNIFSLKIYNFKENRIIIPAIIITSSFYFYKVNYFLLFYYFFIVSYLVFFKNIIGTYSPVKSVFKNFYEFSNKIDIFFIVCFVIFAFYLRINNI